MVAGAGGSADPPILYLVPYLTDPAVRRRLRMLRAGGARRVVAAGFRRSTAPVADIDGVPVVDLGRTEDGRLGRRAVSVAAALLGVRGWGRRIEPPSVVLARSLEALVLARAYRSRFAPRAPLVYETLDIHRALLGDGVASVALRALEARALADCSLLVTSSPGFVREYFDRFHHGVPPVLLAENKMLASEVGPVGPVGPVGLVGPEGPAVGRPPGPPWTIGWFGLLRCTRSLELLGALCRAFPGRVRVEVRGRVAASMGDRLEVVASATPGMTYHGPYDRGTDLARIYSQVHYSWTADFSESGANSDWLLPNRLYEAGPSHCVPLASATVETGRWLAARGAGVLLSEPWETSLPQWFGSVTPQSYGSDHEAVSRIPRGDFVDTDTDAAAFVERLTSMAVAR